MDIFRLYLILSPPEACLLSGGLNADFFIEDII